MTGVLAMKNASELLPSEASSVKNQAFNQGINMSDSTQVQASRAITVPFHGADLYVVEHNGQPYTPMKPIVEGVGLTWHGQHRKLMQRYSHHENTFGRWGVVMITTPSVGGAQEMLAMPLRKLPGWLATIDPGRVKNPDVRARVIQYQNECDDALWQYWNDGIAVRPRNPAVDYERVTPAQKQDLKEIVAAIVKAGVQGHGETWARFQKKFRVNKYEELPASGYLDARQYLIDKLPNGYAGEVVGDENNFITINPLDGKGMKEARQAALDFVGGVRQAAASGGKIPHMESIPGDVLAGILSDAMMNSRFMVAFNFLNGGMQLVPVAKTASVVDLERDDYTTLAGNVPMERLSELLDALNYRVKTHLGAFSDHLSKRVQASPGAFGAA